MRCVHAFQLALLIPILFLSHTVSEAQSLSAATALSATTYSKTQIKLAWADPNPLLSGTQEGGYIVARATAAPTGWTKVFTSGPGVTRWSSTGLSAGTLYYYRVRAFAVVGGTTTYSTYSSYAAATTQSDAYPNPARNLTASALSATQIALKWKDRASNEGGFKVQRAPSSTGPWNQIGYTQANQVTFTNSGLTSATAYFYRVVATNSTGDSPPSNVATAITTADLTPPTVSITSPASGSVYTAAQQVTISASASDNVAVTLVEFYDGGILKGNATALPYTFAWPVTSADNGTHSWTAKAYDAANGSVSSPVSLTVNIAGADTTPPVPGSVTASNIQFGSFVSSPFNLATGFTDSQSAVTGCDYSINGGGAWLPATVSGTAPSFTCTKTGITGANGQVLTLAMRATSSGGTGTASAVSLTIDAAAPTTTSNAAAVWVASDQTVTLTPGDSTGAGVASTQYCTGTTNSCTPATTGTSVAVSCAAGATCQTYVRYRSTDRVGNVEATKSALVRIDKAAPTNGALTATGGNALVALSWSAFSDGGSGLTGVNTYKLVYASGAAPASCASGTQLLLGTATSFTHTGLTNGGTYSYRVCASDVAGNISTGATASATPQAPVAVNPTLVGFVPGVGRARDVVVDPAQGLAYVASDEFGLAVVDVTQPAAPVVLGATIPPFSAQKVAVAGSLALVAGTGWGVAVVDITDPFEPTPIGLLSGEVGAVAMAGQYGYVLLWISAASHYDLAVIDLHVPTLPTILGQVTVAGGASIKVIGSLAYVGAGSAGLQIVDVSNPAAPWIVRTVDTPGGAKGVAVANGYAYVADNTSIQVIRVADPNNPFIAGSLATAATTVAVAGNRLYALAGSLLKIIDVTSPSVPLLLSSSDSRAATGVAAVGTLAFLASPSVDRDLNTGGLYVIDVSIPAAPVVLANALGGGNVAGVAAAGPLAAVVGSGGLRVLDVSDASNPTPIGSLSGQMAGVAMAGQYGYVLLWISAASHYDLAVIDLRVPTLPTILGQVTVAGGNSIKVVGSLAYVGAGSAGLQIVDVSNPAAPRILSTVDTPGGAKGVAVANGYAYVADNTSIQVIRVADPNNPFIAGSLATAATAVAVAGNRLYALAGSQFKIIDLVNPTVPTLISATSSYSAQGFDVVGSLVFLATPSTDPSNTARGVNVLDVSSATQPTLVERIVVPGLTKTVFATSTYVYAGDEAAVLDVIQLGP